MSNFGKLEDIFDKRVLSKYIRLLPKSYNIYFFTKTSDDGLSELFMFYISESILKTEEITSKSIAYISGGVDLYDTEMDEDDLDIINTYIGDKLKSYNDKVINKSNILDKLYNKKFHRFNKLELELLDLFNLRLINREINISFLSVVNSQFLGKGIGMYLLILASNYAYTKYNISKMTLDDDSDGAWNLENNLYIKLGLKYINDEPQPEMEGYNKIIISNFESFRKKYTDDKRLAYNGSAFIPFFVKT